jgi:predicted transcriptional regulator
MRVFVSVQTSTKQVFSKYAEYKKAFPFATTVRRQFEAKLEIEAQKRGAYMLNSSGERRA